MHIPDYITYRVVNNGPCCPGNGLLYQNFNERFSIVITRILLRFLVALLRASERSEHTVVLSLTFLSIQYIYIV